LIKPTSKSITDSIFNRNKLPGLNELWAVINLDEEICALIDIETQTISYINSSLIHFCGFSNDEVGDQPISKLFPDLESSEIVSGATRTMQINRKAQETIQCDGQFNFLDNNAKWLRLKIFDPTQDEKKTDIVEQDTIIRLLDISSLADSDSFQTALEKGAEIIHEVTGTEGSAIYLIDSDAPQFKRITAIGCGQDFPETLPLVDSSRLTEALLWNPVMRVLTDIHKFGRMNGFTHLASAPLSDGHSTMGLVICGGKGDCPKKLTENLMKTIAAQIQPLQQHYLLIENLQRQNYSFAQMINSLDAVFSNISQGVLLLNTDLTIQHINPAAEWILGYSTKEVEGQDYANILIGTDKLSPALEEAKKAVPTHDIGKATLNRRNGQPFPAKVQVVPVMMKSSLIGIEVFLNDISENENNKAVVQHLEHRAVLGDYTSAFAHDIRNPINNISLGIQRINSKFAIDDPMHEVVAGMQNDCTRLNHLMESFLAYARSSDLHLEEVEVGPFLKKMVDRWHPRLMNAHINSHLHIDEDVGKIFGDPRALDRVFTNLISNAVDAMATSGDTLAINARVNRNSSELLMVEITVSDNGPGVPDDMRERIFEPFVSTSAKGTGLGLAITKEIVTAHKGSIKVDSFPGGTNFIVSIPAVNGESI
jgi:PAS domain S-box-containing protein